MHECTRVPGIPQWGRWATLKKETGAQTEARKVIFREDLDPCASLAPKPFHRVVEVARKYEMDLTLSHRSVAPARQPSDPVECDTNNTQILEIDE